MKAGSLSVLTADDLLYPAVTQADDLPDVAVAQTVGAGLTDRGVTRFAGGIIASDYAREPAFVIGHVQSVQKIDRKGLTGRARSYMFLYMESTTYMNGQPVQIIAHENRNEVWVETADRRVLRVPNATLLWGLEYDLALDGLNEMRGRYRAETLRDD